MSLPRLAGVAFLVILVVGVVALVLYHRRSFSANALARDPDIVVLEQLSEAGSVLSKPHPIDFYLYFPSELAAREAASQLETRGFTVTVRTAAQGPDWLYLAKKTLVPTLEAFRTFRAEFSTLTARLKGQYDGWEAAVTK